MAGAVAFQFDRDRFVYLVDGDLHIPIDEIGRTRLKILTLFRPNEAVPVVEHGGRRYIPLMWAQQLFSKKDWSNWQLIRQRVRDMYDKATKVSVPASESWQSEPRRCI
jgi:hypothetical protein